MVVEVDVIVPVHNAAETIVLAIDSAMHQVLPNITASSDCWSTTSLSIHVCCYDDGSTDNSWDLLKEMEQKYRTGNGSGLSTSEDDSSSSGSEQTKISTRLHIGQSETGVARGAGYARNRAVAMRPNGDNDSAARFLCWLDSDDIMRPTRIAEQVAFMLRLPESERRRTLLGCTFDRDPPDSTWHYANWANGLSDERLMLERFRELTLLQPTWMMCRSRFLELGGYLEAPQLDYSKDVGKFIRSAVSDDVLRLVHPTFESLQSLRVAEDLRFFHAHLHSKGILHLLRTERPLLTYRHRVGQSQSSQTPRKLLLYLRALALETCVLRADPLWQKHDGAFVVWGAGRDGKDFVKALSAECRQRVYCFADVDSKKIDLGYYANRDIDVRIPIVHFSLLAADADIRHKLQHSWETGEDNNEPGFGRIDKSRAASAAKNKTRLPPPAKKRKLHAIDKDGLDLELLPLLPVVVCVAMYRTNGALEHNVRSIGRTEGKDLWHFS